jgi:hypothetical protein
MRRGKWGGGNGGKDVETPQLSSFGQNGSQWWKQDLLSLAVRPCPSIKSVFFKRMAPGRERTENF